MLAYLGSFAVNVAMHRARIDCVMQAEMFLRTAALNGNVQVIRMLVQVARAQSLHCIPTKRDSVNLFYHSSSAARISTGN